MEDRARFKNARKTRTQGHDKISRGTVKRVLNHALAHGFNEP